MIVLLSLSTIMCGYTGMIVVFVSDTPEHHCKVSINYTRNATDVEVSFRNQSIWIGSDSCSRYTLNRSSTEAGRPHDTGGSNDTEPCLDGWVFSTERYTATIVSEWDLVCHNAWMVPFTTSLFFVGVLIGSFVSGHFSDRFGRKPVFFFTLALQTFTPLIQATSVSWLMFCILNFLRGLGQISNYIASLILGSEMLSPTARMSYALLGHSVGFGVGYALLPLFAYLIRGWRMLLVASAIPGLLFIPTWWVIPESPRWLLQKGRVEEAELIIRAAAKRNRVQAPEVIFRADECLELMDCYLHAVIDIVVYVATWMLVNRVQRPTLICSAMMFCGIMLLVIKLVPEDMHVMFQVLALVGKVGVSSAYCIIFVIFTELIPTVVRNMGLGVASTAGRIGTIICPFVIYMGVYSKILPYIVFGTISIMAAAVSMLLPDTRNSKLPDLISQAKHIRGRGFIAIPTNQSRQLRLGSRPEKHLVY
ncbi:Solute carrier family 22 member 4 [Dissostichus eleginoides]|uniref:Solute carrier family 22 member 4 n=1 Tax=Dissostichus eleginoides TaxID=100907 RepID=A0AAD9B744_DISEL|nr:Solute carrier family 22 member 4 [Dissostichus eleginoides]